MPVDGGFCAFAMAAENALVPADPLNFKIVDDSLHLFFRDSKEDALALWNKGDEAKLVQDGKGNWAAKAFGRAWAYCASEPYPTAVAVADQLSSCIFIGGVSDPSREKVATNFDFRNGLALQGYDVVSYSRDKPIVGSKDITSSYLGGTYRFATEENRALFDRDAAKYAPLYGGFCAFAMAVENTLVPPDPLNYKIVGGKLHLFFRSTAADALTLWNKNEEENHELAEKHWRGKSYKAFNVDFFDGNLAMGGYDPVSYLSGTPVKGSESITTVYAPADVGPLRAVYRFASAENKAQFDRDPTKYMPVDGGFCAFAMAAENALVPADPLNYKFVDDKLHVFFRDDKEDALALWNTGDEAKLVQDGKVNWAAKTFDTAWAYCPSKPYPIAMAVAEQLSECA